MKHAGGCHCGNLEIEFDSALDPAEMPVLACQCTFCRKHNARALADPSGHLSVVVNDPARLRRYSFGLKTAEYFICRVCGVYVAAVTAGDGEPRAIVNLNCLDGHPRFVGEPVAIAYDAETRSERVARRQQRWTPVTLGIRGQVSGPVE